MELTRLINSIDSIQVTGNVQRKDILSIAIDSRKVSKNSVFIAIEGLKTDGHRFILDAINQGAYAVISEKDTIPSEIYNHANCVRILVKDSRIALAQISKAFYNNAADKMQLIGVTGTNGKTTTTYFIKNILDEAGYKSGLIGTISNLIAQDVREAYLTTPDAHELHALFHEMHSFGCQYAIMEVSSHSLSMKRVHGLNFAAGIFTNITSDHLDFHKDFTNYLGSKKILFDSLSESSFCIVNADDKHTDFLLNDTKAKVFKYGKKGSADFLITDIKVDLNGTEFLCIINNNSFKISTKLIGEFNAYNAAGAFAFGYCLGLKPEDIIESIKNTPQVPGRFEVVKGKTKYAVVDYSHTSDSLEKAILNLRKVAPQSNLITVFGCGGDRDNSKRPIMGKIASELSDFTIVTNDNPRSEEAMYIISQITDGISKSNYEVVPDRDEAIRRAIINSPENSVILIAGKGHEDYQIIGKIKTHFSDKETAQKYLAEIK